MTKKSKRMRTIDAQIKENELYLLDDAVEQLKKCPPTKFDQSIDLAIKLGVDPKKSDQQVRGTVPLPHGTGKKIVVLVFTSGDKVKEALEAGADYAGGEELLEKVKAGWTGFDAVVATPDMMREVGKLGKVLGPRGLMPTPKAGNVTNDVGRAVSEIKAGKIEFKLDKQGVCNVAVGKLSFDKSAIVVNIRSVLTALVRAKPAAAKGVYVQNFVISSTMGPGLRIDLKEVPAI